MDDISSTIFLKELSFFDAGDRVDVYCVLKLKDKIKDFHWLRTARKQTIVAREIRAIKSENLLAFFFLFCSKCL